jgi:excisionase family DNA binding protein
VGKTEGFMVVALDIRNENENTWLTSEDMAEVLGVTVRTVRNMVSRQELERKRMNGRVYVRHIENQKPTAVVAVAPQEPMSHPAVVEMVTTLQQQLLRASQDFADRLQTLNDGLLHEKVEKERSLAEVSRLHGANQTVLRELEMERATYRSEMANQIRRHNTELTRAVANAATEKSDAKRKFKHLMWSMGLLAAAGLAISFAVGANLESSLVVDARRLQFWTNKGMSDPASWAFWGCTGLVLAGCVTTLTRIFRRN